MKFSYLLFALLVVLVTAQKENKCCCCDQCKEPDPGDSPNVTCNENIELGILFDVSNSIWVLDWKKAITFLNDFLTRFKIGPDQTRVALIPYGTELFTKQAFNLDDYDNIKDVQNAISKVNRAKIGDTTETGDAIAYMRSKQLNPQRTRKGVRRACVVLTDGNSQDRLKTELEAKRARDDGIHMFAVGVGSEVKREELLRIAGEDPKHVSKADTFDDLLKVIDPLVQNTCKPNF